MRHQARSKFNLEANALHVSSELRQLIYFKSATLGVWQACL